MPLPMGVKAREDALLPVLFPHLCVIILAVPQTLIDRHSRDNNRCYKANNYAYCLHIDRKFVLGQSSLEYLIMCSYATLDWLMYSLLCRYAHALTTCSDGLGNADCEKSLCKICFTMANCDDDMWEYHT